MWIFKLFGCNCSSSDRKLLCTEESGFKSNAAFEKAVPKYIVLAVVLVLVSAALPAYSQSFFVNIGISEALAPTLANVLNILVQVVLSYPTMKFWIHAEQIKDDCSLPGLPCSPGFLMLERV